MSLINQSHIGSSADEELDNNNLLLLSSKSLEELQSSAKESLLLLKENQELFCRKYLLGSFEEEFQNYRAAFFFSDLANLKLGMEEWLGNLNYDACDVKGGLGLGFIFTGLGSTYPGMGMNLYFKNSRFRKNITQCFNYLKELGLSDIERIFNRDLGKASVVMPLLFSLEYSLYEMWKAYGIIPDAVAGHSVGEFAAGYAAGIFGMKDGLFMMYEMGKLLDDLEEKGAMAAVKAEINDLSDLIKDKGLVIGAENHKQSLVLSGAAESIEDFIREFGDKFKIEKLDIPNGFHSKILVNLEEKFLKITEKVKFNSPEINMVSCVTGKLLAEETAIDPVYWASTLSKKVVLSDVFYSLEKLGVKKFLESGPSPHLTGLGKLHNEIKGGKFIPSLIKGQNDHLRVLNVFLDLYMSGINPDFERIYSDFNINSKIDFKGESEKILEGLYTQDAEKQNSFENSILNLIKRILGFWGELDVDKPVFEYGVDSLMAMDLKNHLLNDYAIEFPITFINDQTTIFLIIEKVKELRLLGVDKKELKLIVPDEKNRFKSFPLTDVQHAYRIGRQDVYEVGNVSCHLYMEIEIKHCDIKKAEQAVNKVIKRHDALRTIFSDDSNQIILEDVPFYEILTQDFRNKKSVESDLLKIRNEMSHQVLDEATWPLFEIKASCLDNDNIRFHVSFDLLIGDAWSLILLSDELSKAYLNDDEAFSALKLSFRDYAVYEDEIKKSDLYLKDLKYWRKKIPFIPPGPELPLKLKPSEIIKPKFVRYNSRLDKKYWNNIKKFASKSGFSPSAFLVTLFSVVLNTWSRTSRFSINLTMFNRKPVHPEIKDIIGDSTSIFLLEADFSENLTAIENLRKTQAKIYEALEHGSVSAVKLIQEIRKESGEESSTAFPVVFTSMLPITTSRKKGFFPDKINLDVKYSIFQTPQVWIDHQVYEEGGDLVFNWDVVDELFPENLISEMFRSYCDLLDEFADNDLLLKEPFKTKLVPEQAAQRNEANSTEKELSTELLHTGFLRQALDCPERTAVVSEDFELSYGDLLKKSLILSDVLKSYGTKPEKLIAVIFEKSPDQITSVLGILFSGAAYLPIDSNLPEERIFHILNHGDVETIVTSADILEKINFSSNYNLVAIENLDFNSPFLEQIEVIQKKNNLAYVIYTSGSTGAPKGVMIDHQGAVNTIYDINTRFNITPEDKVLCLAELGFDLSVYDIFGVLSAGGCLVIPTAEKRKDPEHWYQLIKENKVSLWNSVPAMLSMLFEYFNGRENKILDELRIIMLSGDKISIDLIPLAKRYTPNSKLISLGGATEASIWSIFYPVENLPENAGTIPYGKPMYNQKFYVLDEFLNDCPNWVPGDLYISGKGLSLGYFKDVEKTSQSFIKNHKTDERLYKTGDIGFYRPDGNIEILGREDFQVKIMGHRIELGEIEKVIKGFKGIKDSVVIVVHETKLVSYFVSEEKKSINNESIEDHVRKKLPYYMVPDSFVEVDEFPLNINGKIDRKKLSVSNKLLEKKDRNIIEPETEMEIKLHSIWSESLNLNDFGIEDNFFRLGGDSLQAIRLINEVNKHFFLNLTMKDLMNHSNVKKLSVFIENSCGEFSNESGVEEGVI